MRYLASFQDAEMAALKDSTPFPPLPRGIASRGRDNYSLFGALRTKPGRADSPPTLSMSCSDKIALWSCLGIQGALASRFFCPIYARCVIIGEVPLHLRLAVKEDCDRAFGARLEAGFGVSCCPRRNLGRRLIMVQTHHTWLIACNVRSCTSHHYRSSTLRWRYKQQNPSPPATSVCQRHDSWDSTLIKSAALCWIADSPLPHEILISGIKRGISPKNRHNPKFRHVSATFKVQDVVMSVISGHSYRNFRCLIFTRNCCRTLCKMRPQSMRRQA